MNVRIGSKTTQFILGIHKSDFPYNVAISSMGYPYDVRQTVFLVICTVQSPPLEGSIQKLKK
jgi:hypothetical protein